MDGTTVLFGSARAGGALGRGRRVLPGQRRQVRGERQLCGQADAARAPARHGRAGPVRRLETLAPCAPRRSGAGPGRRAAGPDPRGAARRPRGQWRPDQPLGARSVSPEPGADAKKKTRHAAEQDRPDVAGARAAWRQRQPARSPKRLVFVDETWATTTMARRHGRARRGQRLVAAVPLATGRRAPSSRRCVMTGSPHLASSTVPSTANVFAPMSSRLWPRRSDLATS